MEQRFVTKRDVNGNRVVLYINHAQKRYTTGYFIPCHKSDVTATVTKKRIREMCEELNENGYTQFIKIGW